MAEPDAQRRLAAILAADVAGYSRLTEADEERTVGALKRHLGEFFEPTVAKHGGRIFKAMGDGFLLEFASVLNAVRCAIEIQEGMAARNTGVPERERIVFRIGVNLGDVIVEGADLHGDGVNLAARLEGLADPGGICISANVYDQVRRRIPARFEDMGPQTLKNISEPLQVFRVHMDGEAPLALPLPDKPSIAVLPFTNMSSDAEYEHFVDGLTEDLITDISRNPGLFVIARNSVFAYKGKPTDVRRIARELGVRYLLEGSARRAGGRVRINVQLIDSIGGGHVWAERFDRELDDIFDLQDEVTARVVEALVGQLVAPPPRRRASSVQAYDLCVRGRALADSSFGSADAMREAMVLLEQAIDLDPGYAEAYRCLALTRNDAWTHCNIPIDPARGTVLDLAERAVTLDPNDSSCHSTFALLLDYAGQWDAARREHELALALDPNNADAMVMYSDFLLFAGEHGKAEGLVLRALRINPLPAAWYFMAQGKAEYALRRYDDAIKTLRNPATYRTASRRYLAASLAQLGQIEEARREAALYMASNPRFTIGHWSSATEFRDAATKAHFVEGYRLAGLPE
ncbi:MAG: adenylate/guanylate cyclase domain-containing protein [Proteobacteria bacterium]|nr:adenylate/guanylate cyclase domain-containing protein [Pseudomonadota bacterium]MBS0574526.1 adenylate/guanylate cyclase domain-containing protein [Pseudomonadota bacterium]